MLPAQVPRVWICTEPTVTAAALRGGEPQGDDQRTEHHRFPLEADRGKLGERRQIEPLPFMQRVRIGPVHQQVGATRYRHHVGVLAFDTHGLVEGSGKVDLHHPSSASGAATANPSMMPS